jgi:NADPH2:quinone reductase
MRSPRASAADHLSTSYAALVFRARLAAARRCSFAAAGGVRIAAVQIGKALGARVIATAGGAELEIARSNGADGPSTTGEDFVERVKTLTNSRGADVIYIPSAATSSINRSSASRGTGACS